MTAIQLKAELNKIAGKLSKSKLETVVAYANLISSKQDFHSELSDEGEFENLKNGAVQSFEESIVKYEI